MKKLNYQPNLALAVFNPVFFFVHLVSTFFNELGNKTEPTIFEQEKFDGLDSKTSLFQRIHKRKHQL